MMPTRVGTRMPGMVANMFVKAIKVPAKLGARSAWLENTPENMLQRILRTCLLRVEGGSDKLQLQYLYVIVI